MFPTQTVTLNNLTNSSNEISQTGKSFLFDFEAGDFVVKDGKFVEITGKEALRQWIQKVLKTTKSRYKIYENTEYGITSLKELITQDFPLAYIKSEIEKEVQDTLLNNSNINSVTDFDFKRDGTTLTVSFTVNSIYGTTESEVTI